jgi:uncharacterized tellurite resistance protein B-like protein
VLIGTVQQTLNDERTLCMLNAIKKFFAELTDDDAPKFADNDYRLAAAALLIHITSVDGDVSQAESDKLHALVKSRFALDDADANELIEAAIAADRDAIDMYQFTSQLKRALDEDGRRKIVEMMWQIVYADGRANEFEDNVIWRAADLLGISGRDRVELRQQVAGQRATSDNETAD